MAGLNCKCHMYGLTQVAASGHLYSESGIVPGLDAALCGDLPPANAHCALSLQSFMLPQSDEPSLPSMPTLPSPFDDAALGSALPRPCPPSPFVILPHHPCPLSLDDPAS